MDELLVGRLGLSKLPAHFSTFLASFASFLVIHQVIAPVISRWILGQDAYSKLSKAARNNWLIHIVSQAHALIIVPLSLRCLSSEELNRDRAFGWDSSSGLLQAVASGYFLWDTLDAIVNFIDPGFVIHGLSCLLIYAFSFKPFLAYYASRCLLWETSTIFLNIHWFFDKTNRTGSRLQLINGVFLLSAFFGVRLVYGGKMSYDFFHTLFEAKDEIPKAFLVIYGGGNIVLQGLNWVWFTKMISALKKRFQVQNATLVNGKPKVR